MDLADRAPTPDGWSAHLAGGWRTLLPYGLVLPDQGWKVHVASTPEHAARVLAETHAHCVRRRIAYKHLRTTHDHLRANGKDAARGASGKFLTLYPATEDALAGVLGELVERLAGTPGPYILSDLRIGAGPLHVRYGAFRRLDLDDGETVRPAIRRPDGVLVPDERGAAFRPPDWATIPAVLAPHLAPDARRGGADLPFRMTSALHFSNGGGVYRAQAGDRRIVVKEARPYAGLDAHGHDAVWRLRREHEVWTALDGLPGVPRALGLHQAWEHTFLALSELPGVPLSRWAARHFPVYDDTSPAALAAYRDRAAALADRLDRLLAAVADGGWVFGDLHPRNVLVDDDDRVALVDAEAAFPIGEDRPAALGAPGFRAPAHLRGAAIDRHALSCVRRWLLLPLAELTELAPDLADIHRHHVAARFPMSTPQPRPAPETPGFGADGTADRRSLIRGIHAAATPDRLDRLFRIDFAAGGAPDGPDNSRGESADDCAGRIGLGPADDRAGRIGLGPADECAGSLGRGAAGVLLALHEAGERPEPAYERWLLRHVASAPMRPGWWTGGHGIADVLDRLGHPDAADALLVRCAPHPDRPLRPGLAGGASGIALALLSIGVRRSDDRLTGHALDLALRIAALPPECASAAGLMRGWTGPAALYLRLFDVTGDDQWLDRADRALRRDLVAAGERSAGGDLLLRDGTRRMPYLESGSAGVALVAARLARRRPGADSVREIPALLAACRPGFVARPGLMSGRAGLLLALAEAAPLGPASLGPASPGVGLPEAASPWAASLGVALREAASPSAESAGAASPVTGLPPMTDPIVAAGGMHAAAAGHFGWFAVHAVRWAGGVVVPGDVPGRLSVDLHSGSAGVLLALSRWHAATSPAATSPEAASSLPGGSAPAKIPAVTRPVAR